MEESMFSESSMLLRNRAADRRWADESGEEINTVEKLLAVALSVVIAGGTILVAAMPFALLHLR
jgi:hypothetical protein